MEYALIEGGLAEVGGALATAGSLAYGAHRLAKAVTGKDMFRSRGKRKYYGVRGSGRKSKRIKYMKSKAILGGRPGRAACKSKLITHGPGTTLNCQTLVSHNMVSIARDSGNYAGNTRESDIVNCRGIKVHLQFQVMNQLIEPVYCNWAILIPKDGVAVNSGSFFRAHEKSGTTRYLNFDNSHDAITLHHNPINTDAYKVIKHKRFTLLPPTWSGNSGPAQPGSTTMPAEGALITAGNYKDYKFYMKVNKQLAFDQGSATPEKTLVFVTWCTSRTIDAGTVGRNGTQDPLMKYGCHFCTYFKEPRRS